MGIIQMVMGGGALAEQNYWYANIGGSSQEDHSYGIDVDSSGNAYTSGRSESTSSGSADLYLTKHDKDGTLLWQTALEASTYTYGGSVIDDSGNIYSSGLQNISGYGSWDIFISKHNSSGTLQWQRQIGGSGDDRPYGMCIDSSSNVYIVGELESSPQGTRDTPYIKYNSSGVLQFQKSIGKSGSYYFFTSYNSPAADSSDNIYLSALWKPNSGNYQNMIVKLNSSGTIQWNKSIGSATATDSVRGGMSSVDSSDNIYFAIYNDTAKTFVVLKYNSAGTQQWQRQITGTPSGIGDIDRLWDITTDSDDNVYVVTQNGTAPTGLCIFKWNSSGTLQWQRFWKQSDSGEYIHEMGITTVKAHSFHLGATASDAPEGGADRVVIKLPADGTLTGTVGDYIYESLSYTESAGAYTESSATTITTQTTSLTEAAASFSTNTPTFTNTVTPITGINVAGSVEFDGTGDFLTVPASSDFDLGTGNFTIEGWFYKTPSNPASLLAIVGSGNYYQTGSNGNWIIRCSGTSDISVYTFDGSGNMESGTFTATNSVNTWYHFALVREGTGTNEVTCYLDGTDIGSCTISKSLSDGGTNGLIIGDEPAAGPGNNPFDGLISNLRIIKGTALYTSNFTPSTSALTNITNTKLLCCQSDASATAATVSPTTITASGNTTAVSSNPF
jgi:hypothetical protein